MKENSNGTDTNVGRMENSIEETIERLEKGINDIWFSTTYSQEQEEKDLKILLLDYKRVLKENEEYKDAINVVNKEKADWIKAYQEEKDLKENYIQKVKNKMEKDIKTNEHTILGRRNGKTLEYGRRLGRIEVCKELLEREGK